MHRVKPGTKYSDTCAKLWKGWGHRLWWVPWDAKYRGLLGAWEVWLCWGR